MSELSVAHWMGRPSRGRGQGVRSCLASAKARNGGTGAAPLRRVVKDSVASYSAGPFIFLEWKDFTSEDPLKTSQKRWKWHQVLCWSSYLDTSQGVINPAWVAWVESGLCYNKKHPMMTELHNKCMLRTSPSDFRNLRTVIDGTAAFLGQLNFCFKK